MLGPDQTPRLSQRDGQYPPARGRERLWRHAPPLPDNRALAQRPQLQQRNDRDRLHGDRAQFRPDQRYYRPRLVGPAELMNGSYLYFMKNAVAVVVVLWLLFLGAVANSLAQGGRRPGFIHPPAHGQRLHTAVFSLTIDPSGRITSIDNQGHDYAAGTPPGILLQIKQAGKLIAPTTASLKQHTILLTYPEGKSATISYENKPAYIRLEL